MKKYLVSAALFAVSVGYVVYQYVGGSNVSATNTMQTTSTIGVSTAPAQQPSAVNTPTQTTPSNQNTKPAAPAPTPAPVTKPKGQYADGSYTGSVADAYYGYVQVRATIQGGRLTDVTFLQYPSDRQTSQYINSQAMPYLRQEALQAQSANVSGVSGASDTSAAFRESLGNALSQAKI